MGQNFVGCDRGQSFLLPPSLTDWLEDDHLVKTAQEILDSIARLLTRINGGAH